MRILRRLSFMLVGLFLLAGCSSSGNEATVDTSGNCSQLEKLLANAKAGLKNEEDKHFTAGTPDAKDVQAAIDQYNVNIDALNKAIDGCDGSSGSSASATPTPSDQPVDCAGTWQIVEANHLDNRYFAEGVQSIKDATTDAQARDAALDFASKVKTDPVNLSGAVQYLLHETVDSATLTDGSCATIQAVQYAERVQQAVRDARSITVENASSNGTNSGVDNGQVVVNSTPGISGDTKAIKIVLKDGTVVWILARCGNFVTIEAPPNLPQGRTDQVVEATPTTSALPTTSTPSTPTTPRTTSPKPTTPPDKSAPPHSSDASDPAQRGNGSAPSAVPAPTTSAPQPTMAEDPPEVGNGDPAPRGDSGDPFPTDGPGCDEFGNGC